VGIPHPGQKLVLSAAEGMAAFLNFSPSVRGETRVREQAAEIPFFRSLLDQKSGFGCF
jgi:hypothetical protein